MKRVILFFITVVMIVCFTAPSFAYEFENENAPTEKELAEFASEADVFLEMIQGGLMGYYLDKDEFGYLPSVKWVKEKGYMPNSIVQKTYDQLHWIDQVTGSHLPISEKEYHNIAIAYNENVTLEMIQKDLNSYFSYDSIFISENQNPWRDYRYFLMDEEGRLYCRIRWRDDDTWRSDVDWDEFWYGAKITAQKKNWIETTMSSNGITFTIEYTKTKNGWRISGGSYFEMYYDFGDFTPPETGDSTAPYFALSALSLLSLALAGAAVARKRKKKLL